MPLKQTGCPLYSQKNELMKQLTGLLGFVCILSLSLITSCGNDDDPVPQPSKGSITGTVDAYDDKTTSIADRSGFTVALGSTGKTATTDASGRFSFADVAYDSYDLTVSKTGFGTFKIFGVNLQSTSLNVPTITMGSVSTTAVTSLTYNNNQYNGVAGASYIYSTSPAPTTTNRGYTRSFLSTSNGVSSTNYTAFSAVRSNASNNVNGGFTADELYGFGFRTGQTVYLKMYGESLFSNAYLDPSTGKTVFPNLNSTSPAAISFIVP
jgi:hypothetical protein